MPVLKVSNLSKSFGGIKAINKIDMEIEKGDIAGLIGPNGAGKTTFFNLLTGIYLPTTGDITYNLKKQVNAKGLKPYKITNFGIARTFQNIRLFKQMTVLDNVKTGFHCNTGYGIVPSLLRLPVFFKEEKKVEEEALELLNTLGLLDKKDELARNLPYGEQRRLEIARALASKPEILLLDEPAAGMNPKETEELTGLIKWIRDKFNLTIILIEHDMSLVMNICNKIYVLDYGTLIANGNPEEIQKNPDVIRAYLGGELDA